MFQAQYRETINSTWKVAVSFDIIMTTSVRRSCFTRHARPRSRPDFLISDRSCPKTDGLRRQTTSLPITTEFAICRLHWHIGVLYSSCTYCTLWELEWRSRNAAIISIAKTFNRAKQQQQHLRARDDQLILHRNRQHSYALCRPWYDDTHTASALHADQFSWWDAIVCAT